MAGFSYIPSGIESAYTDYNKYWQNKGQQDISRNALVGNRRSSDVAPTAIGTFNTQFGLGASKELADLSMTGAGAAEQEAMTFGGLSPFTGQNIQGQDPFAAAEAEKTRTFQAGQSEIEREFTKAQNEAAYKAAADIADKQSNASIWAGIFGGAGSLLGGIFGRSK